MQYRRLGRSGIKVSVISLGSYLTIGHHVSDEIGRRTVETAYDGGVNFFDTANAYNRGEAEKALGRYLSAYRRDSYVLATKVWAPMGEGPNDKGLSRKHIFEQCHASLTRLQTDYIDLYQCHRYDSETPMEETIRAMDDLIRQGKVLYWGVSEWSAEQIAAARDLSDRRGFDGPVSNQPRYSLLWRHPEREVFPYCRLHGIGQVVFSPLAHGVLAGKYRPGEAPAADTRAADRSQNQIMMDLYFKDDILRRAQEMKSVAEELGATAAELAIAWILTNPGVSSVITGATKVEQLESNLKAAEVEVPDEAARRLEALFPAPTAESATAP